MDIINNNKNKLPTKGKLIFLLFLINIHLIFLIFVYFDLKYILLIMPEIIFFLLFNGKIKQVIRILLISIIVFAINCMFYEGKIVFQILFLKITEEGIVNGFEKTGLLVALFLFTNNVFNKKNKLVMDYYLSKNDNLLSLSVRYFYSFLDILSLKLSLKRMIIVILNKRKLKDNTKSELIIYSEKDFMLFTSYNIIMIMIFVLIFLSIRFKIFKLF
jgi:hypothetical protein